MGTPIRELGTLIVYKVIEGLKDGLIKKSATSMFNSKLSVLGNLLILT